MFFSWDNLGWGEVGCYGGRVLRGAPTPRIDQLAADGLKLLTFNAETRCTPGCSAVLTGLHPIRLGTHTVPITGGPDGLTQNKYGSREIDANACQLAKQIKAAEGS